MLCQVFSNVYIQSLNALTYMQNQLIVIVLESILILIGQQQKYHR